MTSANTGWALRWTSNPGATSGPAAYLLPARTVDGARRWKTIAPRGSRAALLSTPYATVVLHALNGQRAWLAVTAASSANQFPGDVHRTRVYVTGNGGRTWTRSAALNVPGFAEFLSFPDATHGWLLQDLGSEDVLLGADYADVYRTADGGLHWSKVAHTPPLPSTAVSKSGLPVMCDKAGMAFASLSAGWLAGARNNVSFAMRVTRDGGYLWSAKALPFRAEICSTGGRVWRSSARSSPRADRLRVPGFAFTGAVLPGQPEPRQDGGEQEGSAVSSGLDPRITFFSARDFGVLVSAARRAASARSFYTTANASTGVLDGLPRRALPSPSWALASTSSASRIGYAPGKARTRPVYGAADVPDCGAAAPGRLHSRRRG